MIVFFLANFLVVQARVFEVNPIPDSFTEKYDKAGDDKKDSYFHWCDGTKADPAQKDLVDGEFHWFGDYTNHIGDVGGSRK